MIFKNNRTLYELLKLYGKESLVDKIPESLREERLGIYGGNFIDMVVAQESWIDTAVANYLSSPEFLDDLKRADDEWSNRTEYNVYWIQLELDSQNQIHLQVDFDIKDF